MKYIVIDTCFWRLLLHADLRDPLNEFDEILYWIEMKALKVITCKNLINEWDRNRANNDAIVEWHRREYLRLRLDPGSEQYTETD